MKLITKLMCAAVLLSAFNSHAVQNIKVESDGRFHRGVKKSNILSLPRAADPMTVRPQAVRSTIARRSTFPSFKGAFKKLRNFGNRRMLALTGIGAMGLAIAGCGDDGPSCNPVHYYNNTELETLELRFLHGSEWVEPGTSWADNCNNHSTRYIEIYEKLSGELVDVIDIFENTKISWYTINDPLEARLRIDNQTPSNVELTVDGRIYGHIDSGTRMDFPIRQGYRLINLRDASDPSIIYYNVKNPVAAGEVLVRTIQEPGCVNLLITNPYREIINVYVDGLLYGFQNPTSTVIYKVPYGVHYVEVLGTDSYPISRSWESFTCGNYNLEI